MDQTSLIREKVDIVAFISEFISLKKAGRNFKANCPFHNEKSPSFVVSPERQIWHCFGCQKGGDIFTFLMEYEHLEFPEALRTLAKRAGIELANSSYDSVTSSKKEILYKINALALEFYHYILTKHAAGKKGAAYLTDRKINQRVWETFKIGFAPHFGNALSTYLLKKKRLPPQDIVDAGLGYFRGKEVSDFFSGRLIFPLIDHRDNVTGFSGRVIDAKTYGPKYINTRETLVYHKGDQFFGLNIAKEAIRKQNQAVVTEGEFDVIACFQQGILNTVAIKGTALTEHQVSLLSRFTPKVTICFDGDPAGQEAIKRSLPLIEKKHLQATVIVIPNGKDPDESIKSDPYAFKKAVDKDVNAYDYLIEEIVKKYNPHDAFGKEAIASDILPLLSQIDNEIIKEHYLKKLSIALETTYESLLKEVERRERREIEKKSVFIKVRKSREEMLEEYLVSLIVQYDHPKIALEKALSILKDSLSKERAYQKIIDHLLIYFSGSEVFDGKRFAEGLPVELMSAYDKSFLFPITLSEKDKYPREIENIAIELREIYLKQKMKKIADEIKQKEKTGDDAENLRGMYSHLVQMLKKA